MTLNKTLFEDLLHMEKVLQLILVSLPNFFLLALRGILPSGKWVAEVICLEEDFCYNFQTA